MKPASLSKALSSGLVLAIALVGATDAQSPNPPAAEANSIQFAAESRVFQAFGDGSDAMRQMRERLEDPQQRAILRDEQRAGIVKSHYGVAEALELDETTYAKLIDALTDQQMEQLDDFHLRFMARVQTGGDPMAELQDRAEHLTRRVDALREVLGQEKLERYQVISSSLGERIQVSQFDERLDASHKLSSAQREQLIEVFRSHNARQREQHRFLISKRASLDAVLAGLPSREELQRRSQLDNIASNEEAWRRMPEDTRRLRDQAAALLTTPQLATLERLHAERARGMQQRIEQMRVQAGLSPTIPDRPEVTEPAPVKVAGEVKLSLKVAVNRAKPAYFTQVVSSGQSVSFEIDEGLIVEATPTLHSNDVYDLSISYYETGTTGKRLIGNMGQSGTVPRASTGDESSRSHVSDSGGSTVITGSKAYAIHMSALVEAPDRP